MSGKTGFDSTSYKQTAQNLKSSGQSFARSTQAKQTGNYVAADILDASKLKNGMRECCYRLGVSDALPIIIAEDLTASMEGVPVSLQARVPELIGLIKDSGSSDNPNILTIGFDDEHAIKNAMFQMSQFETDAAALIKVLNEIVIPGRGAGNQGEAYHLAIYAAAFHTKQERLIKTGEKGFFFLICDEEPYYYNGDVSKHGTSIQAAKEIFGDTNEKEITMVESMTKLLTQYHVFIIRPAHTQNGTNKKITVEWQNLLSASGGNPENVLEIEDTEAIIPTISLVVCKMLGADHDELDEIVSKSAGGTSAVSATKALALANGVSNSLATVAESITDVAKPGRTRS